MKYKTITKKQILKAIKEEPLAVGKWFHTESFFEGPEKEAELKTCPVCAVGAVMRNALKTTDQDLAFELTNNIGTYSEEDLGNAYANFKKNKNNFLSLLSCEFENFNFHYKEEKRISAGMFTENIQSTPRELLRLHALSVVEAFCPKEIKVKIPKYFKINPAV